MAEGWAEATQGVKWSGWCVAQRARAGGSVGRLQEGLVSTSFTRVCCHSEGWQVMKSVVADLCSRAASSAHERDGEMEASGDSLPETSSVVQHSIACPKSLLSAFLSRWMDAWLSKASWCRTTVDDVEVTALRECAAESPVPTSQ
jgi:hypothetical protein